MIRARIADTGLEIVWKAGRAQIKTTDKRMEQLLRVMTMEAYDPWETRVRTVRATRSERDAYILLSHLAIEYPELEVEIEKAPELETQPEQDNEIVY